MNQDQVSQQQSKKPLLIFDGDCGFCMKWVVRLEKFTRGQVDFKPYQEVAAQYPQIPVTDFEKAVHFVGLDGKISKGALAIFQAIETRRAGRVFMYLYRFFPGFSIVSEQVYVWVADHRTQLSQFDR